MGMEYPTAGQLRELSPGERLKLIEDVWDTFVGDPESLPLSESHAQTIDARLDGWEREPGAGAPWEEVRRRIANK